MQAIAEIAEKWHLPIVEFHIEGHTNMKDEAKRGNQSQMRISEGRAIAVHKELLGRSVDGNMISPKWFGGKQRKYEDKGGKEDTKNQRVEITLANAGIIQQAASLAKGADALSDGTCQRLGCTLCNEANTGTGASAIMMDDEMKTELFRVRANPQRSGGACACPCWLGTGSFELARPPPTRALCAPALPPSLPVGCTLVRSRDR